MNFSFFALGYFFGSIPFGYLISIFFFEKDIREYYSKNIGATNISRVFGMKVGILVFILDFLKAYLPSLVTLNILNYKDPFQTEVAFNAASVVGAGSVMGHLTPYLLEFRGGKGVATFFGAVSALNLLLATLGGIVWIVLFLLFRISAVSSLVSIAFVTTNLFVPVIRNEYIFVPEKTKLIFFVITVAIFLKHTENIIRMIEKREHKL